MRIWDTRNGESAGATSPLRRGPFVQGARPRGRSDAARRTDVVLGAGTLITVCLAVTVLAATGLLDAFLSWAWGRHHNVLSWYVRPLFLLPLAYFSYRRSFFGIVLTLVALASSMFWFPAPERVDPRIEEFLAFEKEWLTGAWTAEKVVLAAAASLMLGALCLVFWRRSFLWGLAVLNAIALAKMAWGVLDGAGTGWAMLGPALAGLLICNAAVLYAARKAFSRPGSGGSTGCPDPKLPEAR